MPCNSLRPIFHSDYFCLCVYLSLSTFFVSLYQPYWLKQKSALWSLIVQSALRRLWM